MACVRIKADPKASGPQSLIKRARSKAADLLEDTGRVLVVFDGEAVAKIYYETTRAPSNGDREN